MSVADFMKMQETTKRYIDDSREAIHGLVRRKGSPALDRRNLRNNMFSFHIPDATLTDSKNDSG
jgi:hypothetical protein